MFLRSRYAQARAIDKTLCFETARETLVASRELVHYSVYQLVLKYKFLPHVSEQF